jgi:hypothetical protein
MNDLITLNFDLSGFERQVAVIVDLYLQQSH